MFPFNFLSYVQSSLSELVNFFMEMFGAEFDDITQQEIKSFVVGDGVYNSPMDIKILNSFKNLKQQREALGKGIKSLNIMIKELEAKPKDSSFDEEIKELNQEKAALTDVRKEIDKKNVFNFLSDEGLIPNYAFLEAGITLRAVLYRKEDEQTASVSGKRKYETTSLEYSRSASSAISEFAPNNSFYVDGRKLIIDQVDLTTAQTAKRLLFRLIFLQPLQSCREMYRER
ncbi:MAG: hypothetical protein LUG66_00940 [Clostridiales bacterium]|nr:hypothetical protein [Clostridiales bacterium]